MKITFRDWCNKNSKQYLLDEWDCVNNDLLNIKIDKISYGSGKIVNWICPNGHHYKKRIDSRTTNHSQCPYCSSTKKQFLVGFNDLATLYPDLINEWNYDKNGNLNPKTILPSSQLKVWWTCSKCKNTWYTSICSRTRQKHGCPYCAHLIPIIGENDL